MAWYSNKTAGFPEGGSIKLARDIEKRYLSLGGRIHYNNKVNKIIINDNKAVGVILADGTELYSDLVISAFNGVIFHCCIWPGR